MVPISEKSYGRDFRIQRWNHNPTSNVALDYCKIYGNKKQFKTSTWMLISNSKLYCKILLPAALSAMCTPNVWNFYVHGSLVCKVKCIDKYSDPMENVSIVCSELRKSKLYWIETKLVISVYHDTSLYPQNTGKCWRWERERESSLVFYLLVAHCMACLDNIPTSFNRVFNATKVTSHPRCIGHCQTPRCQCSKPTSEQVLIIDQNEIIKKHQKTKDSI